MLSVSKLSVTYGPIQAARDIDFVVPDGSLVAIVGANGAGKSSVLNAIAGLVKPASGRVVLDGAELTGMPAFKVVRAGITLVPEGRMVAAPLTVLENLRQCRRAHRSTAGEFQLLLERVYELFPILATRRRQVAGSLSGGEQQMLALARAVLTRPQVLMLDEPSLGLAPAVVESLFGALIDIHASGQTILLVEQNVELALELCDYGLVLQRGTVAASGSAEDLRGAAATRDALLR